MFVGLKTANIGLVKGGVPVHLLDLHIAFSSLFEILPERFQTRLGDVIAYFMHIICVDAYKRWINRD